MSEWSYIAVTEDTYSKLKKYSYQFENWDIFFNHILKLLEKENKLRNK
jgi:hypothetical protein